MNHIRLLNITSDHCCQLCQTSFNLARPHMPIQALLLVIHGTLCRILESPRLSIKKEMTLYEAVVK